MSNEATMNYELGEDNGEQFILCKRCGRKSYHPRDIVHRYCGHCQEFHDLPGFAGAVSEALKKKA